MSFASGHTPLALPMHIFRTIHEYAAWRDAQDEMLALVPTMGALHAGHISLVDAAKNHAKKIVVTIFVNPTQFDRKEDLEKYPRTEEADLAVCEAAGVAAVLIPQAHDVYADDRSISVTENRLSNRLCGATRPGHFSGVCLVVLKLFNICRCDVAVFGKKDFQQLAIIKRMVRDLNVPIKIIAVPTMREPDGLAMSSRNVRLTSTQRQDAPIIRRSLLAASDLMKLGERNAQVILAAAQHHLTQSTLAKIDYLELVDAENLEPIATIRRPALLASAVFYDSVRLIDNIELLP